MTVKINFLKVAPLFGTLSLIAVACALYLILLGKGFKLGTDFKGGVEFTVTFAEEISVPEISKAFEKQGVNVAIQPVIGDVPRFFISTSLNSDSSQDGDNAQNREKKEADVKKILIDIKGPDGVSVDQIRSIGGVVSSENTDKAFKIIFWVIMVVIAYITLRFKFQYGLAAIVAVMHDVLVMLGALVITESEINVYTITAVLTIFGYSVNDTIVLFDRIREYLDQKAFPNFRVTVNESINSIFSRTLITSLTTLAVVTTLFYNTQGGLKDFSFALIIGLLIGTYSSVYVATNFLLVWNRYKPLT